MLQLQYCNSIHHTHCGVTQGRAGAGQGRAGQSMAGDGRAGQGMAGHGQAWQGMEGQGRAWQGRGRAGIVAVPGSQ